MYYPKIACNTEGLPKYPKILFAKDHWVTHRCICMHDYLFCAATGCTCWVSLCFGRNILGSGWSNFFRHGIKEQIDFGLDSLFSSHFWSWNPFAILKIDNYMKIWTLQCFIVSIDSIYFRSKLFKIQNTLASKYMRNLLRVPKSMPFYERPSDKCAGKLQEKGNMNFLILNFCQLNAMRQHRSLNAVAAQQVLDYQQWSLIQLSNQMHRHLFTMLFCSLTPPTMLDTIKFIG